MNGPLATIIIPTYNEAGRLGLCIDSLRRQSVTDWEMIVVDDGSRDNTEEVVAAYGDPRIRYLRNATNLGEPASRNVGIQAAQCEYIFFVDADCVAAVDWLEQGLRLFEQGGYAGLEGKLIFVSPDYRAVYSDRVVENLRGGQYMTANMAYRKSALVEAGLFDARLRRYCDRDIALKVLRCGEIHWSPELVVTHARTRWTPSSYFNYAKAAYYTVLIYKLNPENQAGHGIRWHVYAPEKLIAILLPPLVLLKLLTERFRTREDYILLALMYPRLIYERILLWKSAIQERVLLL